MSELVGVDGCPGGWLCVADRGTDLDAFIVPGLRDVLALFDGDALIAIDIPIGLTDAGSRTCDLAARRLLGAPRSSSVFPAPVRACLTTDSYTDACAAHLRADGRKMSRQAFRILPKIREVDGVLSAEIRLQSRVREVHPEVSFAFWNGGAAMRNRKKSAAGRGEREDLIDATWPGARGRTRSQISGLRWSADDLNDAFAALWTAQRIRGAVAVVLPEVPRVDARGLRMEIVA